MLRKGQEVSRGHRTQGDEPLERTEGSRTGARLNVRTRLNGLQGFIMKARKAETQENAWIELMPEAESHVRVRKRLRICKWKSRNPKYRGLRKAGANRHEAEAYANSSVGYARAAMGFLMAMLTNACYTKQGYKGFYNTHYGQTEKQQSFF